MIHIVLYSSLGLSAWTYLGYFVFLEVLGRIMKKDKKLGALH
jgi:hypothetical protein